MKVLTSREFNQDAGGAKRAASEDLVVITDRGEPSHVMMSFAEYKRLANKGKSIAELLAMPPGCEDTEFEIPERKNDVLRPADFS